MRRMARRWRTSKRMSARLGGFAASATQPAVYSISTTVTRYRRSDSNGHRARSERAASASWATSAWVRGARIELAWSCLSSRCDHQTARPARFRRKESTRTVRSPRSGRSTPDRRRCGRSRTVAVRLMGPALLRGAQRLRRRDSHTRSFASEPSAGVAPATSSLQGRRPHSGRTARAATSGAETLLFPLSYGGID